MTDSNVIGLRVRPWMLNGKYLVRTNDEANADSWAVEKCTLAQYSDGKTYLNWSSIYDFGNKETAILEMNKMSPQLKVFNEPSRPEPPQAGDLVLLQAPGSMNGSIGVIQGIFGEFASEFDVHLNADTDWMCEQNGHKSVHSEGGLQYRLNGGLVRDTQEVIYQEFQMGHPSEKEGLTRPFPVRLYMLRIEAKKSNPVRKTA